MNERSSNGAGSSLINSIIYEYVSGHEYEEEWFRNRRDMLGKWQIFFKDDTNNYHI